MPSQDLPPDLSQYHNRLDIIRETAEQLQKDFEFHGEEILFSGNPETAYAELYGQLQKLVGRLLNCDRDKLLSLLYRIDVNESAAINAASKESPAELITELILDREFRKVLTRHLFKHK